MGSGSAVLSCGAPDEERQVMSQAVTQQSRGQGDPEVSHRDVRCRMHAASKVKNGHAHQPGHQPRTCAGHGQRQHGPPAQQQNAEYVGDDGDLFALFGRELDDEIHVSVGFGLVIKEDYQLDFAANFSDFTDTYSFALVKFF